MRHKGFTLIELLVVIAIIGTLASVVLASLNSARESAAKAKVESELNQIRNAIALLELDTGLYPGACPGTDCQCDSTGNGSATDRDDGNGHFISNDAVGLITADSRFANWAGPYFSATPNDPWGNEYIYDSAYNCGVSGNAHGCVNAPSQWQTVIHSGGPNGSGRNRYDNDNIVLILNCQR